MFPSILHDAKGPLIHLSCVQGTPPLVISLCLCLSCGEAAAPFQEWGFFYSTRSPEGFGCGASGMWALWEQHHPQTQTTAIDFSVNSAKKKREKKKRGTIETHKKSCLLNNSLFPSVDTALTKYSTLRIVHIGRTEEGGKTCGPGFPSQVWTGCRYLSSEEKTLRITRLDVYFPTISQEALFFSPRKSS